MNYLGIIAICLGLISIMITIQNMNNNEKTLDELKFIRSKCIGSLKINNDEKKLLSILIKEKNKKNYSWDEMKEMNNNNLGSKEEFKNYMNDNLLYKNAKKRGFIEKKEKNIINTIFDLKNLSKYRTPQSYKELLKQSYDNLIDANNTIDKNNFYEKINELDDYKHKYICSLKQNSKNYCIDIPRKDMCKNGIFVNNKDKCDYY